MMIDWNEYHKANRRHRLANSMKLSPDTVRGYQTLSAANSKTGKLDEKTRQLISLAVAVTTRCDGCIVVHSDAALKAGATKEEIAEALGVAVAMNAGAALIYSTRVLDAVAAKTPKHRRVSLRIERQRALCSVRQGRGMACAPCARTQIKPLLLSRIASGRSS